MLPKEPFLIILDIKMNVESCEDGIHTAEPSETIVETNNLKDNLENLIVYFKATDKR